MYFKISYKTCTRIKLYDQGEKIFFPPKHHWKGAGFTCEPCRYIRYKAWMRVGSRGSTERVTSWGNVPCWQEHSTQSIQCLSSVGKAKPCSGGSRGPARFPRESRSKWVTSMCKDCSCSFFPSDDYSLRLTTWRECLPKVANLFPWAVLNKHTDVPGLWH